MASDPKSQSYAVTTKILNKNIPPEKKAGNVIDTPIEELEEALSVKIVDSAQEAQKEVQRNKIGAPDTPVEAAADLIEHHSNMP